MEYEILKQCNLLEHPQADQLNFLLSHVMEYNQLFFGSDDDSTWVCLEQLASMKREKIAAFKSLQKEQNTQAGRFALKMWRGDIRPNILYLKVETKMVQYRLWGWELNPDEKTIRLSGNLSNMTQFIFPLGYVQVHPNYLVRKIHVVAIDFTFVYMSDMRKIKWSRKSRESNWELLKDKYRRDSQWNVEKTWYVVCDL
jgi:hypothetical protein